MAKKVTSYQKLKNKILELEEEKRKMFSNMVTLVRKPDSLEAAGIKMNVNLHADANDLLWFGDRGELNIIAGAPQNDKSMMGLTALIQKNG